MTLPGWHEEPTAKAHDRKGFDCGHADLNDFLSRHARQAHESGAAKTYVAVDDADNRTILGFYMLSPAQIDFEAVPIPARPAGAGRHPIGGFRLPHGLDPRQVEAQFAWRRRLQHPAFALGAREKVGRARQKRAAPQRSGSGLSSSQPAAAKKQRWSGR